MAAEPAENTAVKARARDLGADLVGIAAADVLDLNPPAPRWPQTPRRIWRECRSVVVLAKRIPWGFFWTQEQSVRLYAPHTVVMRLEEIALDLAYFLEGYSFRALPLPLQHTDPSLKKGAYGPLSLRHVAVEAGLSTLGLNLMLLTPQFGPRVYLAAVLTDMPLEPDGRLEGPVCLGPKCGRCLLACPADAVGHWNLDKGRCRTEAQRHGISALFQHLDRIVDAETKEAAKALVRSQETVNFWTALHTGAGAYGGCLRCWEVCPVGDDYEAHLKAVQARIPDVSGERRRQLQEMVAQEQNGDQMPALYFSTRWVLGNGASPQPPPKSPARDDG